MHTNIEAGDELMRRASRQAIKRPTLEGALELLVKIKGQERIREAFGTLAWDDDLKAMRLNREDSAKGG